MREPCLLAAVVVVVGDYLAYLMLEATRANAVLPLVALAFVPTTVLYLRYFDPLLPVLFGCLLRTRESESLARSWAVLIYPGIELALIAAGYVHYGPLLAARLAAEQQ